jgi:hypothetical protein
VSASRAFRISLLKNRKNPSHCLGGNGIAALQQFTGINVVFYYGAVLWQAAGFTEADALLQNVITGTTNIGFTILAIYLVERVGRKPLLMIGGLGQAIMLGILALLFTTGTLDADNRLILPGNNSLFALLAANGYVAFFAFTWGPIMWVMLGEMFSNRFRGAALAMAGLVQWVSNFHYYHYIPHPAYNNRIGSILWYICCIWCSSLFCSSQICYRNERKNTGTNISRSGIIRQVLVKLEKKPAGKFFRQVFYCENIIKTLL